ncbi:ABC transporter permease [Micromonospora sediminimaris]|uniref:ABC transporter permease n=1 Tax=Micromonospora sediminimaris TaxID=547162 RepID=A0A9W5UN38_9ACTN|nr:ABC transporter permease [Micromonospora sediminimaris]GIJ32482.1 ABC transporter permease [Micromonospora sediminimaris]SFD36197.1 putative ABC transport system permease protein [Micromonospora sediminimaris]
MRLSRRRSRATDLSIRPSRLRLGDLAGEAALAVLSHPGRSLATVVGTIVGAAAFVASLGLGSTLNQQVTSSFDVRRATEVVVQPEVSDDREPWLAEPALQRLTRLNGVVAAGRRVTLPEQPLHRTSDPRHGVVGAPVLGTDPSALRVIAPALTTGRYFDSFQEDAQAPVVMLSEVVARQLGVHRVGVAVFIAGRPFTVIGIYHDVTRRPEALAAAIIPYSVAHRLGSPVGGRGTKQDVLIETFPGAAQLIGRQAPLALRPEAPTELRAIAPPDPATLRREIEDNTTRSTLMISVIALLIGTISIGNATTAGIAGRTGEIGLRRAVGARSSHIFLQLVLETAALGFLGGVTGALLGVLTTSVASVANGWTPVIEIRVALIACAISAMSGLLAGLLPAARAARLSPVTALQK